jgi:hypothetical protein
LDRSRAGLQRAQHRCDRLGFRAMTDPNRHAVDLNLDNPGTIYLTRPIAAPTPNYTLWQCGFHNRRHEQRRCRLGAR